MTSINQQNRLILPRLLMDNPHTARDSGVVKESPGKRNHAFDQMVTQNTLPYLPLRPILRRQRPIWQEDGGTTVLLQMENDVLQPRIIGV